MTSPPRAAAPALARSTTGRRGRHGSLPPGRRHPPPGPRVWREVTHGAQGTSLGEAVRHAAAVAARHGDGESLPRGVPGNLAWLIERAVDDVGAVAVLNDLLNRDAAA